MNQQMMPALNAEQQTKLKTFLKERIKAKARAEVSEPTALGDYWVLAMATLENQPVRAEQCSFCLDLCRTSSSVAVGKARPSP